MRVKVIREDNFVSVDGVEFFNVDLSSLDPTVSAIQWFGTHGEIEHKDHITGSMIQNVSISDIGFLKSVLDKCVITEIVTPTEQDIENQRRLELRAKRDFLLATSDWTQIADVPQTIKDKWAPYRQALRDVPQQAGFPDNIQWPVKPE
jgi:hypothetical protein